MKSDADSLRSTPTPRAEPVPKPDETLPPTRRIVTARPPHPRSRLRGHPQASSAVSSSQLSRRKSLSAAEFRHRCNIVRRAELPPIRAVELRDQAFSWPFWIAGRRAGPFCTSPVRPGHKSLLLFTIGARNLPSGNGTRKRRTLDNDMTISFGSRAPEMVSATAKHLHSTARSSHEEVAFVSGKGQ